MPDPDIAILRSAIKRLRKWRQMFKWGGGYPTIRVATEASVTMDRIEERLNPQQVELWEKGKESDEES